MTKGASFKKEDLLEKAFREKFGNGADNAGNKIYLFSIRGLFEAMIEDINHDFNLIFAGIFLVFTYTFLFLGSFSPIHCRCVVALAGIISIGLAYTAGFGLMYLLGG